MADHQKPKPIQQKPNEKSPTTQNAVKFVTAVTIGATLLVLSGLTLTGTVIALVLATPLFVIFSPIIVPAGIGISLATVGFLSAGGLGVAALSALQWIYNYVTGKHPPGSDQVDLARMKLANTAREVKESAKAYGQYVQNKAQEVASQGS